MKRGSRFAGLLAALVMGVSGGALVAASPASAAACAPTSKGVTVVVGSTVRCDPSAGGSSATNFTDVGFELTRTRKFPGFVCRVDGVPASDPCATASPADAYWALFWSDGTSGTWVYSQLGVDSLTVPAGGSVAWTFQNSNSRTMPAVNPTIAAAAKPKAQSSESSSGSSAASSSSGASASSGATSSKSGAAPSPKASASARAKAEKKAAAEEKAESAASPSASPTASGSTEAAREAELERAAQETTASSSTLWVGAALAIALLIGTGLTVWRRRSRQS